MTLNPDVVAGVDPDIRPQDDLFGHVNGRWLETVEIPSDRAAWGPFVELADEAEKQVLEIVEACARGDIEGDEARKIGDLYTSFMDEERIERLGAEPVLDLLAQIDALTDKSELAEFLGRFERRGNGGLFGSYVDNDDRQADRYIVNFSQGGLGLPDEAYYREDKHAEIRTKYVEYLTKLLTLANVEGAAAVAANVMALETELAKGHWERTETRDVIKTYNLRTLAEVQSVLSGFDLSAYVAALGGDDSTIAEICVREPSFFEHLQKVLDETPLERWQELLKTKALRSAAAYLSNDFVEVNFDFYGRTLSGTPEMRPRWKRGVALVEGALGEAVGQVYVARHFPPDSKRQMDELVGNLLEAYRRSIGDLDWMSEETKQRAFEKLDKFRPKIGYPVKWRDYSALQVDSGDLLGNVLASAAYETDRELRKIGSPVDRDEWFMLPQTVNAYYNPGTNEICFPAAILQPPFFSPEASLPENYGGIGAVIGHEIGHGFDDQGAQFDGDGNLNDWWTPEDKAAFEKKSKALIEQYNGFSPRDVPGEHVNGALTVGENIGDLGGLTIAHLAYQIASDSGDSVAADDAQKLFFNWALCWRTKNRKERAEQLLAIDPHSPAEFRANIVRNLREFHRAFDTTEGDGLWLDEDARVRIW